MGKDDGAVAESCCAAGREVSVAKLAGFGGAVNVETAGLLTLHGVSPRQTGSNAPRVTHQTFLKKYQTKRGGATIPKERTHTLARWGCSGRFCGMGVRVEGVGLGGGRFTFHSEQFRRTVTRLSHFQLRSMIRKESKILEVAERDQRRRGPSQTRTAACTETVGDRPEYLPHFR